MREHQVAVSQKTTKSGLKARSNRGSAWTAFQKMERRPGAVLLHRLVAVLGMAMVWRSLLFWNAKMNTLASDLIQRFKDTFTGVPQWAWPFKPSIPLIGDSYKAGKSLLIYASAENLSWLNDEPPPQFFTNEDVWNRYRFQYEMSGRNSKDFFPYIGIQPVNDGGLLAAGLFFSQKIGLPTPVTPRLFLETIAVTNWCKFSVKSTGNKDHISHIKKLADSLPYVTKELALLQPAVVLTPKPVWTRSEFQTAMRNASPQSKFFPIYQFNANVVNCHLKEYDHSAVELKCKLANTPIALWMENLKRLNKDNAWRYLATL